MVRKAKSGKVRSVHIFWYWQEQGGARKSFLSRVFILAGRQAGQLIDLPLSFPNMHWFGEAASRCAYCRMSYTVGTLAATTVLQKTRLVLPFTGASESERA